MKKYTLAQIKNLPQFPGVYQFFDTNDAILYIGKAKNLRKRVISYLRKSDYLEEKIVHMVRQARYLTVITVPSEFEALILEARLINIYQPKYNSIWKDDKHYIYIKITREIYPRILLSRKQDNHDYFFGPFPSSNIVKEILVFLRTIFPYCTQSRRYKKACLYTHLGLCNPCPGQIATMIDNDAQKNLKQYQANIRQIRYLLSGKINNVRNYINHLMRICADRLDFEKAAVYRDKLQKLNYLTSNYRPKHLDLENYVFSESEWPKEKNELTGILHQYFPLLSGLHKIECYDVSNISGIDASGAMVTFIGGQPEKNFYRRFKIHITGKPNDFAMLSEIVRRRLSHKDWGLPELLVLDGGKPQLSAIAKVLTDQKISLPVIGLAKRNEEIIIPHEKQFVSIKLPRNSYALRLIQRLRDESHRFAHKYHTLLRLKYLMGS